MDQQAMHDTRDSTPVSQPIVPWKKRVEMLRRICAEFAKMARRICKSRTQNLQFFGAEC